MKKSKFPRVEIGTRAVLYRAEALRVLRELEDESIDAVITDPPYSSGGLHATERTSKSVRSKYQQTGTIKRYPDFSGDNRDQRSWAYWCHLWLSECFRVTKPGGPIAIFTDWRQLPTVSDALQAADWVWRGVAVWSKSAARPAKGRFRNQCEYIVWGSRGAMPQTGPCLPGCWQGHIAQSDKHHVTGKPSWLMEEIVRIAWREDSLILDPFAGSGTTGKAAIAAGKRFVGIEREPAYFAIARERIAEAASGTPA